MSAPVPLFLLSFTCGLLFYRLLFLMIPRFFQKPLIRTVFKIRWHHWHTGILLILVGAVILVLTENIRVTVMFLGIGLGLTLDVFLSFFFVETKREEELSAYRRSLNPTLLLGACVIVAVLLLSLR